MPLPDDTDASRALLQAAIRAYLAEATPDHPPVGGLIYGALLNKWRRTDQYDPQRIYVVTREGVVEAGDSDPTT